MGINEIFADALNKIDAMIVRHRDWNEESTALGLISDEEKLKMLKRDLYCEVRLSNPNQQKILNLTGAIQTLEEIKHDAELRKLEEAKLNLTMPAQINQILNGSLAFILLIVVSSYPVSFACGNALTQFCGYARSVTYFVNQFFREPDVTP
ncbi:hypothetical protein F7734_50540 [Scytonema sp. UIC 10036]|uniref:hypothetical protein n=1 Tax=Scytonema sp. UIC 10036 TaxID=2304196 RepID=UPI0012DA3977|nr:hypothetical protein [Scytonema sp. UIC 10036]MUH00081.1 hypothetical protein [Scytonema sp. UIC 10036]